MVRGVALFFSNTLPDNALRIGENVLDLPLTLWKLFKVESLFDFDHF